MIKTKVVSYYEIEKKVFKKITKINNLKNILILIVIHQNNCVNEIHGDKFTFVHCFS